MRKKLTILLSAVALLGTMATASERIPADVNGDGKVNTADVVEVYNFILNMRIANSVTISDFPAMGWSDDETIGTPDTGKSAWAVGDMVTLSLKSPAFGTKSYTLTYDGEQWNTDVELDFTYLANEQCTATAIYNPIGVVGVQESLDVECSIDEDKININFKQGEYSRLRIAASAGQSLTVTTTGFTPAGASEEATEAYTIIAEENGNAYLYGIFTEGAKVIVKYNDTTLTEHTFETASESGKSYALDAICYSYNAESNTYVVYKGEYLQTAIDEAELTGTAENHATVKLMADVEVAGEPNEYGDVMEDILVDAGVIILDLNGHTITGSDKSFSVITIGYDDGETTASATLTIDDSSEGKQGKIIAVCDYSTSTLLYVQAGSKLIVNNGTFEGKVYGIDGLGESISIIINGGAFKFGMTAINPQNSSLTITGGTFEGSKYALHFNKATKALITGGSFTGGDCDINTQQATGFLSFNEETGVGPTFPGGFSIYNNTATSFTLNPLLAEGAAYYDANGNQLTLEADATSCEGDVTVKRISTDE